MTSPQAHVADGIAAADAPITITVRDGVALVTLNRPAKRNALNDGLIHALRDFFTAVPAGVKVAVIHGSGECFSAGLDLSELTDQSIAGGIRHSRLWHKAFEAIEFGDVPVISALHGAVVGGGLELAASTHIRVADATAYFALPEGQRGIFVGGGGSVRLPRLIGVHRMTDMMLTGRVLEAQDAQAIGLVQYVVEPGAAVDHALGLAARIANNAPLTNFAVVHALPRAAQAAPEHGLMLEALMAAIAQGDDLAKERLNAFLAKRAPKVR
ncbi:crotonase/enoyl-CoA hydratase family protein [Novispirillum sp. DQ9]|uniref:crotonase/enoyl-CoA hydratase family protein n=1 Tax=Novispirillum sp. DQ9 TaxID=3398612 RepID=UPI003C7BB08D